MKQAHKAQHGESVNWGLFWLYIPTIFVMGLGGHAIGTWLTSKYGMPDLFGSFLSAWLGFLGPEWVQRRVEDYIDKSKPKE